MCSFPKTPRPDAPRMPAEYAAQKAPSMEGPNAAGNNMRDRLRGSTNTMLTDRSGVGSVDTTGKKVLLGS